MTQRQFLGHAYDLPDRQATADFCAGWAASHDAEITENGYATPARCVTALASHAAERSAPVLDLGCGTGSSGLALAATGFGTIDGTDLSAEMLAQAAECGVNRRLLQGDLADPLPVRPGTDANAAAGAVSPGQAPPKTMDAVLSMLPSGGCRAFSLNDHALADRAFSGRIDRLVAEGAAGLLICKHGPHLPGIGLEAAVDVPRKP